LYLGVIFVTRSLKSILIVLHKDKQRVVKSHELNRNLELKNLLNLIKDLSKNQRNFVFCFLYLFIS
jgi:hypothetical protein